MKKLWMAKVYCPYCFTKSKMKKGDYVAESNDDEHYTCSLDRYNCPNCRVSFFTIEAVDMSGSTKKPHELMIKLHKMILELK